MVVYLHRRKDITDPFLNVFYVGIGTLERAYRKNVRSRNKGWLELVFGVLNGDYDVEILHNDISNELAEKIEIELVDRYGRKNIGQGNLVNINAGGRTPKHTKESKEKISNKLKGKKKSQEQIEKTASKKRGTKHKLETIIKISNKLKGRTSPNKGKKQNEEWAQKSKNNSLKFWENVTAEQRTDMFKNNSEQKKKYWQNKCKKVNQFENGVLLKTWDNIRQVVDTIKSKEGKKLQASLISSCCTGKVNKHGGYEWEYV